VYNAGGRPKGCFGRAGTKDPKASDTLYSRRGRPLTVNTMPEETLIAFADHGEIGPSWRRTAATAKRLWTIRPRGIDIDVLGANFRNKGPIVRQVVED